MSIIIGQGPGFINEGVPVFTKQRNRVPTEEHLEHPPIQRKAAETIWKKNIPSAVIRSSSACYNCVGMVFASRRTCIDITFVQKFLTEDGYSKLVSRVDAEIGDVVLYGEQGKNSFSHVGTIIEIEVGSSKFLRRLRLLSKWGYDGEYIHDLHDVPKVFGVPLEYWTDRKD